MYFQEGKEYANNLGLLYFEASAKNNINIQDIFLEIAKKLPSNGNEEISQKIELIKNK